MSLKFKRKFSVIAMCIGAVFSWGMVKVYSAEPPHIVIEKVLETTGELCPEQIIDVRITLYGDGSAAYVREPIDAVCVIDKSGSMIWGGDICYNEFLEPPYGTPVPPGSPPSCNPPYIDVEQVPYVKALWAAWRFYKYLVDVPPSVGYQDYGGLIFYGNQSNQVPGNFPVLTPAPVQGPFIPGPPSPTPPWGPKDFWWHQHLAREPIGGATAMGPGMQMAKEMLGAMPTHPAPLPSPGVPTPPTPYYDVTGRRYMVVLTDGRPNQEWTWGPTTPPPSWSSSDARDHAVEMARRSALREPWGPYTEYNNITIYTIGLGPAVDAGLMQEIAHPFMNYPGPKPTEVNEGDFHWALTDDDLIDVFEEIAAAITYDRAGTDIEVHENWGGSFCANGEPIYTDIVPNSWPPGNPPDIVYPTPAPSCTAGPTEYTWHFDELRVNHQIDLTFQIQIEPDAPVSTNNLLLECPDSSIEYTTYHGDHQVQIIPTVRFDTGICYSPTPTPPATPTPTFTPTNTPTCLVGTFSSEDFESGDYSYWENYGPVNQVQIIEGSEYAHSGDYCAFFAGSDEDMGPSEAMLQKTFNLASPYRQHPYLDFYVKLNNLRVPEKKDGKDAKDVDGDRFLVYVVGSNTVKTFTYYDELYHGSNQWFHYRIDLEDFAGDDIVTVRFHSDFQITMPDVEPDDSMEPMVFIDDVSITDYCYEMPPAATNTPVYVPVPSSSTGSVIFIILLLTVILSIPILRR